MLITTCPSCQTKYRQKDDESINKAVPVECCICGYDWIVSPLNTIEQSDNKFKSVNEKLKSIKQQQSMLPLPVKIGLPVLIVLAVLLFGKNQIANTFSPMAKLYQAIGLLEVKKTKPPVFVFVASNTNKIVNNKNVFKMKVVVRNTQKQILKNPKLAVEMYDLNDNLLGKKVYKLNTTIKYKETKVFGIELVNAKLGTTNFKVKYFK